MADPGPFDRQRRVPDRKVLNPAAVDDGSRTLVDLATGEMIELPPSEVRARRLARRATAHAARVEGEAQAAAERAREWAQVARDGLPAHTPPGLERPVGYQAGDALR